MGITRILKIGTADSTNGKYLYNSIEYILKPTKTENGLYVGGNSGTEVSEVYQTMIDTKREYQKLDKRQGYHFIISFTPGEADAEQMYHVLQDFCEEYLGENYDYVFSVHTDQAHMHGHIVFNSVSRTSGYKYRYEKGDWEKYIQPITDRVCERYGLPKLEYDKTKKKGKSYAEHFAEKEGRPTYKKIVQADIDYVIGKSDSYEEFLEQMKILGYRIKTGKYVYFTAPGYQNAKRDYKLGPGYSASEIKARIADKKTPQRDTQIMDSQLLKAYGTNMEKLVSSSLSEYQKSKVRIFYRVGRYLEKRNPYTVTGKEIRKAALHIDRLYQECAYILQNDIRSPSDLKARKQELEKREKQIRNIRSAKYILQEDEMVKEYETLCRKIKKLPKWDDSFEELQEQMEMLETRLPTGYEELQKERDAEGIELKRIRTEKRMVSRMIREEEKQKRMEEQKEWTGAKRTNI